MRLEETMTVKAERMFSLVEVAEYHKVPVERIHALAEAGHFGPTYKQRRGRGLSRESYIPESAMKRPLPEV